VTQKNVFFSFSLFFGAPFFNIKNGSKSSKNGGKNVSHFFKQQINHVSETTAAAETFCFKLSLFSKKKLQKTLFSHRFTATLFSRSPTYFLTAIKSF
jgi:flagellar hook-basal body complex protein FliE